MSRWQMSDKAKVVTVIVCAITVAVLFVLLQNVLRPVIVLLVSLAVGLAVAGYFNMLLHEKANWRMFATGFAVVVPVSGIAWLFLGTFWLILFVAYTGGLTLFLFTLEVRQRGTLPRNRDE